MPSLHNTIQKRFYHFYSPLIQDGVQALLEGADQNMAGQ